MPFKSETVNRSEQFEQRVGRLIRDLIFFITFGRQYRG